MISKKIVLSTLIVAFVGVVAASGTWALYNDVITNDNNQFSLKAWTDLTVSASDTGLSGSYSPVVLDTDGKATITSTKSFLGVQSIGTGVFKYINLVNGADAKKVSFTGSGSLPAGTIVTVGGHQIYPSSSGSWDTYTFDMASGAATDANVAFTIANTNAADANGAVNSFTVTITAIPTA